MKFKRTATFIGLACGTFLALSTSAQAASFKNNVSQTTDPEADIWLNSIIQNSYAFSDFNLVKSAKIIYNDAIKLTGKLGETANPEAGGYNNNTGAASTDRGDKATKPGGREVSGITNPTGEDIAAYLGNTNLNNIIDTEDGKTMKINLFFKNLIVGDNTGLDDVFFWERGRNSDLNIQAIDANGNLIGNSLKLERSGQDGAGFSLDTLEIHKRQAVGTWGVKLSQLGVISAAGIRVSSDWTNNGPDFKVIARQNGAILTKVPEPATLLGLGLVAGSLVVSRSRKLNKAS